MEGTARQIAAHGGLLLRPAHSRDRELVRFVGRHGVVEIEHCKAALGVNTTAAYTRVAACIERGLLQRIALLRGEPSLILATRDGLRYARLGMRVARVSVGSVEHSLRATSLALALGDRHGHDQVLTEREIAFAERLQGGAIFSAKVGEHPNGHPQLHRPDLAIATAEKPIAVELELTAKAPRRLEALLRAWRRADWVAEVHYYCEPGQARGAVERAVRAVKAERFITILEAPAR